jgi:hypothetical protein
MTMITISGVYVKETVLIYGSHLWLCFKGDNNRIITFTMITINGVDSKRNHFNIVISGSVSKVIIIE